MSSSNVEEYLEAIYGLEEEHKPATTNEIAKRLKFSAPSVTEMLQRLGRDGYAIYEPYKGVTLTDDGRRVAKKITRKHRLLEHFLGKLLNIRKSSIHQQACEMEHVLSDEAENSLCKILGHPDTCPDGKPIPICDKDVNDCVTCEATAEDAKLRSKPLVPLCSLRPKQKAIVRFVRAGTMAVKRLNDLGVVTGTKIELRNCAPLEGPVEIIVRGSSLAIGHGLAAKIYVEAC
jgi:DtxR family Mn-dependent transcriptional regulator